MTETLRTRKRKKDQPLRQEADILNAGRALSVLRRYTDIELSIIAASLLDAALKYLLVSSFIELSREQKDRLFDDPGPLSGFSAKIRLAHAMGLIPNEISHDLDIVRRIRNDFAHSVPFDDGADGPSFSGAGVGDRCNSLIIPDRAEELFESLDGKIVWKLKRIPLGPQGVECLAVLDNGGWIRWSVQRSLDVTPPARERFMWCTQAAWMFMATLGAARCNYLPSDREPFLATSTRTRGGPARPAKEV